jgi:AcrR family transcriptional regulator
VTTPTPQPRRRTQRERREATMAAAIDATISAISELGYHSTTVRAVCSRAGLSQGAVTRHFPTRLDLIVAAAEEVARRQEARFTSRLAEEAPEYSSVARLAIRVLRDGTRTPLNAVWLELVVAARTSPELAARMGPLMDNVYGTALQMAALMPGTDQLDRVDFRMLVMSLVHLFNGEALSRIVVQMPDTEDRRLALVSSLVTGLLEANDPGLLARWQV